MPGPRVSVTSTRAVVAAAGRRGVDVDELLISHGLVLATLQDPDARLEASIVHGVWQDASERAGEPELPVLGAMELPWGSYRVIDYLCGHANTFGDATRLLAQHFGLVNDVIRLQVDEADGGATMRLVRTDGGAIPWQYVDYALTACSYRTASAAHGEVAARVELRRAPPVDRTAHTRAFGPHVHFAADADVVTFTAEQWARPMLTPDPGLRAVLQSHAQHVLASIVTEPTWLDRLRAEVEAGLPYGRTELSRVARRLSTSPRTVQRRLAETGHTWTAFVRPIQEELSETYLGDRTLSVAEVACLVGYADATSFSRAFARRTGLSPGVWRHAH
jgi:AraC-like DNA-binding protein